MKKHILGTSVFMVLILVSALASGEGESPHHPQLKAPSHGLEEVACQDVSLKGGFWGPRLEVHHKTTVPHVLDKLEEFHHITNFDVAARVLKGGVLKQGSADTNQATKALEGDAGNHGPGSNDDTKAKDGEIVGHSAFDSDVYKTLEGACYTLTHTDDPALQQRVDAILSRIVAAQQSDGYLVSYFTAKEPANKWANLRLNHEMYNAGHFFEFAVARYLLDGDTKALNSAKRFADHIDSVFGPSKRYDVDGHQEVELALVKLYRATHEKRYLDLCRFLLEERGNIHGTERKLFTEVLPRGNPPRKPGQTNQEYMHEKWSIRNGRMQDHKPVLQQTEAVGHAVRAGYMYAAMVDIARFSEAPEYGEAVRILWEDVVSKKMYITGGIGTAQYGDEGFGDPYLLPNKTYCESCSSIANVLWQYRMNLMDGDAKYADVMELVLYNSAISGMSISGNSFVYQNPLESAEGGQRKDWIGLACCPTNHARFTPQVGSFAYAKGENRINVNLYVASEATIDIGKNQPIRIKQETNYPWDGKIKLTLNADASSEFDLGLRIPGWALGHPVPSDLYRDVLSQQPAITLTLNGETVDATPDKFGYARIKRSWNPGDVVELNLPMPVRRVISHPKVVENANKVALMRGPVVYCFEGIDQPGTDVFQVTMPRKAELTSSHSSDLLGGVTVIQASGFDGAGKAVDLTAIPYFAWANRSKSPMILWLRESKEVSGNR